MNMFSIEFENCLENRIFKLTEKSKPIHIALFQFNLMTNRFIIYIIMNTMKKPSAFTVFAAALLFFSIGAAYSQEALKSTEEEYFDFLSLLGLTERPALNYRTLSDSVWAIKETDTGNTTAEDSDAEANADSKAETINRPEKTPHPWQNNNLGTKKTLWKSSAENTNWFTNGLNRSVALKIYGPEWFNSYNTAAPYGQNDGALWQGKGYNTSLTTGVRLEAYGFEVTVKPQVALSQNLGFEIMPGVYGSEYSYFWAGNIDLVQRYGDSSFWTFDWGDTELRWSWNTFTIGFGFQSPWLGPAWLNPMLGSNNSGTYPKFDIGLRRTKVTLPWLGWYIGDIEGRIWCGKLSESDYFDNDSSNDYRQLTGFSIAYSPAFLPELTFSINKISIARWDEKSIKYLNPFYDTNAVEDQKCSFAVDLLFPAVGFEFYGELGLDDYNSRGFANPFHTAIYTIGAKKEISFFQKFSYFKKFNIRPEIIFEWNNFEMSQDFQLQWHYMGYYSHGLIKQGYTQNGQIIGAGSGYFGNSQYLALRTYFSKGDITFFIHFNKPDTNYLNNKGIDTKEDDWQKEEKKQHDQWGYYKAIRTFGCTANFFATKFLLISTNINGSWIINSTYKQQDKGFGNYYFSLSLKYNF